MKFDGPAQALEWAETILSIREGGRSNAAMMEMLGGGACKDYAILDAIEIRNAAILSCKAGCPCPYRRPRCLFHWYLPDPCIEYPVMSWAQEDRVRDCCSTFRELLEKKHFLTR